LFKENRVRV